MWVSEGKAFQAMVRQAGVCVWSRMSEGNREDEVKGVLFGARRGRAGCVRLGQALVCTQREVGSYFSILREEVI